MSVVIDPKAVLAKAKAEASLQKKIDEQKKNIPMLIAKHRGHCLILLKDGSLYSGTVQIATRERMAFQLDGTYPPEPFMRINVNDIAEIELH